MVLTFTLGVLLLAGLAGRVVASWVRLPKVTLYILAGLCVGPSLLHWVPEEHLAELDPFVRLALALVLFDIGSRFGFGTFGRLLRHGLPLSIGDLIGTFLFVSAGLWLLGEGVGVSLLLGGLAMATAPATTIVVLRDYDSEGPVTGYTYVLVALNNLAAIMVFELLFVVVELLGGDSGPAAGAQVTWLAIDLAGSTSLGILGGLAASFAAGQLSERDRTLATLAIAVAVLGTCELLGVPYLLTFLAMGTTVANASPVARELVRGLDPIMAVLYVIFFTVAGAELHLDALRALGLVGVAYIALRCVGKYAGVWVAALLRHEPVAVRWWLGATLIPQAGAAIGLVRVAAERDPQLGGYLETIIVGTVVFFELVGPILAGQAVVRSGEVPIAHLVAPDRRGPWEGLKSVLSQFRRSIGADPWAGRPSDSLLVRDLMRQNVQALSDTSDYLEVLEFIEHSRHLVYPVVDAEGRLAGVIHYRSIRSALFDPQVEGLVRADDLCDEPGHFLHPDQPIDEALARFEKTPDDVIPVVPSAEDLELIGLVERRDAIRFVKRRYRLENHRGA